MTFATRFAPSPTGYLHRGHAFSALTAFEAARQAEDGRFMLRIEDIDATRSRPEFEAAILEDLTWLGLEWEHAGPPPVRAPGRLSGRASTRCATEPGSIAASAPARSWPRHRRRAPHGPAQAFTGGPLPPDEEAARLAARRALRLAAVAGRRARRRWAASTA